MPKAKPKPKAKAAELEAQRKAEEEAAAEQAAARVIWKKRKEETQWTQTQISALASQREAAAKSETGAWLIDAHKWHESQLSGLVKCLEGKLLDEIPQGIRDGINAYVAQCAQGAGEEVRSSFNEHRDIYAEMPDVETAYFRPSETAGDKSNIEEIQAWTDVEPEPMEQFTTIFLAPSSSACVHEAALVKLGALLFQKTLESGKRAMGAEGLKASSLMPAVAVSMKQYSRDADVQRRGCAVIRGFALMEGQLTPMLQEGGAKLVADACNAHARVPDVVKTATATMEAMASKAEPGDYVMMKDAGVYHERN